MTNITSIEKRASLTAGNAVAAIVPGSIEEVFRLAKAIAAAGWAPKSYLIDTRNAGAGYDESKITVGIIHGLELGLTPIAALQSIAVINGSPSVWGDGALAIVQASGLLEDMREEPIDEGKGVVGYRCTMRRRGVKTEFAQTFTLADADRAGLLGKAGPWQQYRNRMLQMRARAWVLRAGFADVLRGLSIAEEQMDIIDVTPSEAAPVAAIEPPRKRKSAKAALDAFASRPTTPTPPQADIAAEVVALDDNDPDIQG
jgi:hypothetical protein